MRISNVVWVCAALSATGCSGTSSSPISSSAGPGGGGVDTQTDPHDCGLVGHDCVGGACKAGVCQPITLASGQASARGIAVDATSVYWAAGGVGPRQGTVSKVPLGGGGVTTLASGQDGPSCLAVDSRSVYWGNAGTDATADGVSAIRGWPGMLDGSVVKAPLAGGAATPLAQQQNVPGCVAVSDGRVYWTDFGAGTVQMTAIDGGPVWTLAAGQDGPNRVAVDGPSVYWTNAGDGTVVTVSIADLGAHGTGGTIRPVIAAPVVLASGQDVPNGIAVDAGFLYWTNSGHVPAILPGEPTGVDASAPAGGGAPSTSAWGSVMRMPVWGGTPTALATGQDLPVGIATDATNVYWTNFGDGTVRAVPKVGGEPATLASGQAGPHAIAVDAAAVYWTTNAGGTVTKVAKPASAAPGIRRGLPGGTPSGR